MVFSLILLFRTLSLLFTNDSLKRLIMPANRKEIFESSQPKEMRVHTMREMIKMAKRST
jgi:hypothetical protein